MLTPTTLNTTTQHLADEAKDGIDKSANAITEAAAQLQAMTRRGLDSARELSASARDKAARAGDSTIAYIHNEPVKAVLMAAAAGAVITLLASALTRRGN